MAASYHSPVGIGRRRARHKRSDPFAHLPAYMGGAAVAAIFGLMSMLSVGPEAALDEHSGIGLFFGFVSSLGLSGLIALAMVSILLRMISGRFLALYRFSLAALAVMAGFFVLRMML